jgi:diguanylate cyclase (GGDEF)-like protein
VGTSADSEFERLNALRRYAILDTPPEGAFDRITALAAELLDVPWSAVSLVDTTRVWYKSVHGDLGHREVARLPGLCGAAIARSEPYVVENAPADLRTHEHPLVTGAPGIGFYVGVPLRTHDGHGLGTLSCMDRRPRSITPRELRLLGSLAAIVMDEIELRRSAAHIARLSEALAETCNDLERRANFDALTGVLARSAMLARTAALIERAGATGRRIALVMVDVDRFKAINDGYGHAIGDVVLKEVAARMAASCRGGDLLGRIGGEEFLAVFADVPADGAGPIAERLREAVARTPVPIGGGTTLPVSISGGLLTLAPGETPPALSELLSRADAALYAAKAEGRNRIVAAGAQARMATAFTASET